MHTVPRIGSSKGVLISLVAVPLLLLLAVVQEARTADDKVMMALYEAAKKEGGLTVYSPAELVLYNLRSGMAHHFGKLAPDVLRRSFGY